MQEPETKPGSAQERTRLIERRFELEQQISLNSCDTTVVSKLREEYRQVCDRLEGFYDDEKNDLNP